MNLSKRRMPCGKPQHGLIQAKNQYVSFLDALRQWEPQLGFTGITFDLEPNAEPETLEFQTMVGPIHMTRSLVLHDERLCYALAFNDPLESVPTSPVPPLWWVKLSWTTPWVAAQGTEFTRDFSTDATKSHQVLDLLQCVTAEKLLRTTRALPPI